MKTAQNYINVSQAAAEAKAKAVAFNACKEMIVSASMQNRWVGVWVLRKYAQEPSDVATLVRYADNMGVEVRGSMSYSEAREFTTASGSISGKAMGLR